MKKSMGIVLIVVGVILTVVGIVMVSGGNSGAGDTVVSVAEMNAKRQATDHTNKSDVYAASSGSHKEVVNDKQSSVVHAGFSSKNSGEGHITAEASKTDIELQTEPTDPKVESKAKTSKEKGDEFEDFTVNLLADWRMKLLRRTQDKMSSGGVVAESCKEPDLHIEQKRGNSKVDYHLECKYRSKWTDNSVTFEDWQIKRYREFQKTQKRKVLIALGVGGLPSKPQTFMIVPLDSIKDNVIRKIDVGKYAVSPTSDGLAEYIDHYFDEVFASARGKKKE